MNALVTGATGFIGRRLVAELVRRGAEVACLVRRTSDITPLKGLPVRFVTAGLNDAEGLSAAVGGRDFVFHLAGVVRAVDERAFEEVNVEGTRRLLQACLEHSPAVKRFVFVSSIAAAGPGSSEKPVTESDEPRPVSAYGRSKLAAERLVLEAAGALPVTVVRPPNVLGPGSRELEAAVTLVRRRLFPSFGDDRPRTSLIDVDDLVAALILAAESPAAAGRVYFVTDGRAYAWNEITHCIAEELGVKGPTIRIPYRLQLLAAGLEERAARRSGRVPRLTRELVRAGHDYFWIYEGSAARRDLGFSPRYGLRDSIRRALDEAGRKFSRTREG